ncbi:MAG TPA: S24/S26 family peptidase [Polyangia bacterium]
MASTPERINLERGAFGAVVEGLLAEGLCVRFRAGGHSMTPTIEDGEILIVAPATAGEVDVADLLFCSTRSRAVAHRLLAITAGADGGRLLTLCGDAALETDRPVAATEVRGRVIGVERAGRRVDVEVKAGSWGRRMLLAAFELRRSIRCWRARRWLAPLASSRAAG